ncbi:hypothetical protein THI4931_44580 [Pandoraea sputorum]|nr:hypothetical protein THI4931_44580 [Pandoraea sputorum]
MVWLVAGFSAAGLATCVRDTDKVRRGAVAGVVWRAVVWLAVISLIRVADCEKNLK